MSKHTINSESSLSILIGLLRTTFKEKRYFQVTMNTGKKRSNDQNSTSHCWYLQISREEGQHTPEEVKCLCKYHIGLPILRGDDSEFDAICREVIDPLPYPSRIKAMIHMPVTSLMTTLQYNEYLEQMQRHYAGRVVLEFKKEEA